MSWLVRNNYEHPIKVMRRELNTKGIIKMPGAHDAMAALLAQKAGFSTIYLSGAALTASLGIPDLGVLTLTELTNRTREIVRATGMPLLVDIDTGYGSILNVTRTVFEMIDAGAAAIQLEDQELPKKCGHLNGKVLVTKEEMVRKIRAAREADPDIVIIARTDSFAQEGLENAVDRAKAYFGAGADIIFPEALQSKEDFERFARSVDFPLLANMTEFGRTPMFTAEQFEEMGYKIVIYPVTSLRIASKAVELMYKEIAETGTQSNLLNKMQTRQELYDVLLYEKYELLDESIAKTNMEELIK
ncbi:2-methylisocitrate lyase [Oceanobacillus oncorhynchi subsp. incaldanensis]|uniref:methylisocitrate lyase n=1 Tax=Oceanobacillus oncorhynchi TaxID=545501 RepID=UPI001B2CE8CA|nr:methylisocitrate lyase [Oceanobacillus oncorhynchi]UUI40478.1 methylisocitrate lyase [Oceanobacillus oncorhynchi]GIO18590.1 2-methylisocitrate lyase [Oceanobacillus oncorhynchi subsp. incaldanensis]